MRTLSWITGASALLISLGPSTGTAQVHRINTKAEVSRGQVTQLVWWGSLDDRSCTAMDAPSLHIHKASTLGGVLNAKVEKQSVKASERGNSGCVGLEAPVTRVMYQAGKTPGQEQVEFALTGVHGTRYYTVTINVK